MGIQGAAIATVIGNCSYFIILLYSVTKVIMDQYSKKGSYHFTKKVLCSTF